MRKWRGIVRRRWKDVRLEELGEGKRYLRVEEKAVVDMLCVVGTSKEDEEEEEREGAEQPGGEEG